MMSIRTFLAFILAAFAKSSFGYQNDAVLCPLSDYYIDDEDQPVREFYECPGKLFLQKAYKQPWWKLVSEKLDFFFKKSTRMH